MWVTGAAKTAAEIGNTIGPTNSIEMYRIDIDYKTQYGNV